MMKAHIRKCSGDRAQILDKVLKALLEVTPRHILSTSTVFSLRPSIAGACWSLKFFYHSFFLRRKITLGHAISCIQKWRFFISSIILTYAYFPHTSKSTNKQTNK
jgi:hypothetical protein